MGNEKPNDGTDKTSIGLDAFLEDIFSLNITGMKTLWTVFWKPARYYAAARDMHWFNKYTPAFRLWLSLVAVVFFLQFFWGGENSPVIKSFSEQLEAQSVALPNSISYKQAAITFANYYFGLIPPVGTALFLILGSIYFAWGQRLSFTERQRFMFASIIPDNALSVILISMLAFVPSQHMVFFVSLLLPISLIMVGQTAYRGAFANLRGWGRAWRSLFLAFSVVTVSQLTSLVSQMLTFYLIQMKYG